MRKNVIIERIEVWKEPPVKKLLKSEIADAKSLFVNEKELNIQ